MIDVKQNLKAYIKWEIKVYVIVFILVIILSISVGIGAILMNTLTVLIPLAVFFVAAIVFFALKLYFWSNKVVMGYQIDKDGIKVATYEQKYQFKDLACKKIKIKFDRFVCYFDNGKKRYFKLVFLKCFGSGKTVVFNKEDIKNLYKVVKN